MKKKLYWRFLLIYLLLGCLGLFLTTTLGAHLVERKLETSVSQDLYQECTAIASDSTFKYQMSYRNISALGKNLSALAAYQDAIIWVINSQNEIIYNSRETVSQPVPVDGFDPTLWGESYYTTGDFFGNFSEDMLSVMAPVTANMTPKGYIVFHYPLEVLYQERDQIVTVGVLLFFLIFLLFLCTFFIFSLTVFRPLQKSTEGAQEFARGNLDYRIPVNSSDEIGYLANTLNYMSDRMNETGEYQQKFIANISHDFRSPLTSIKGYVEAIQDGTIPYEMQNRYLGIVAHETERLEKLTRSLLTLNALDVHTRMMNIQSFDINQIIKSTASVFEGICTPRKIQLELILMGESLQVRADEEQIQQVLYNLLDNAIKFSPDHASITIETTEKNGKVFVSVKDRGIGISKENLSKIWERFYKIDSSRGKDPKGTGLGLSIVKEILSAHGQNIDVISTEGVGTEFIFSLERA